MTTFRPSSAGLITVSGESGTSTVKAISGSWVREPRSSTSMGERRTLAASTSVTSPLNQSESAMVTRATPPEMLSDF